MIKETYNPTSQIKRQLSFLIVLICSFVYSSVAQVRLPRLFSDGMVIQRDQPIRVYGWAAPGENVSVTFKEKTKSIYANPEGKWQLIFPVQKAGGPYEIAVKASNSITIKDVLIGDVWICGGQSNMELPMSRVKEKYEEEMRTANNDRIRHFTVPDKYDFNNPASDMDGGKWLKAVPGQLNEFSAVAYFFAKEIYSKYKIPIGLINSALGGSPAESWISEEGLSSFPSYLAEAQRFRNQALIDSIELHDRNISNTWYTSLNLKDEGLKMSWRTGTTNDSGWKEIRVPGYWNEQTNVKENGVFWYRRNFSIPSTFDEGKAKIELGRIVDADSVFINGSFVGQTTYQYPPRRYTIPSGVLKSGPNTLVVRVISNSGNGGFVKDKPYFIASGNIKVDLSGTWQLKQGASMSPLPGQTFIRWKPLGLYNSMIAPLIGFPIKGIIWYQGEANTKKPEEYKALMETLINDWRAKWNQGQFPFLFVQLANFMEAKKIPTESNWAATREAQRETLSVPNTAMAVAIDIGNWNDIHPENKKDVGERLARAAQRLAYGNRKIVYSGPVPVKAIKNGNSVEVEFGSADLIAKNGALKEFAIAGEDRKFVWASATIKGKKIIVSTSEVLNPVYVRYAWADNPDRANLYNSSGLPASPFEIKISNHDKKN